jgi:hypothetical protein
MEALSTKVIETVNAIYSAARSTTEYVRLGARLVRPNPARYTVSSYYTSSGYKAGTLKTRIDIPDDIKLRPSINISLPP